jgi:hypothetical protein
VKFRVVLFNGVVVPEKVADLNPTELLDLGKKRPL